MFMVTPGIQKRLKQDMNAEFSSLFDLVMSCLSFASSEPENNDFLKEVFVFKRKMTEVNDNNVQKFLDENKEMIKKIRKFVSNYMQQF